MNTTDRKGGEAGGSSAPPSVTPPAQDSYRYAASTAAGQAIEKCGDAFVLYANGCSGMQRARAWEDFKAGFIAGLTFAADIPRPPQESSK